MLGDVIKVLESDLVYGIEYISVYGEDNKLIAESDSYTLSDYSERGKQAKGKYAKKHKIDGFYFYSDACEKSIKLPPGLTGAKHIRDNLDKFIKSGMLRMHIAVVWTEFMDHNCSDYIILDFGDMTVNYQNQDWYTGHENYGAHLRKLANLLDVDISELCD